MKKQTLYGVGREFGNAWNDFVLELAYSLGIHHVCSWLTRVIRRCQGRRGLLTKEGFERGYAERSGLTLGQLHELGGHGEPCDCDADDCRGWQMVFSDGFADITEAIRRGREAGEKYLRQSLRQAACALLDKPKG